jgi:hypothetical protein
VRGGSSFASRFFAQPDGGCSDKEPDRDVEKSIVERHDESITSLLRPPDNDPSFVWRIHRRRPGGFAQTWISHFPGLRGRPDDVVTPAGSDVERVGWIARGDRLRIAREFRGEVPGPRQ